MLKKHSNIRALTFLLCCLSSNVWCGSSWRKFFTENQIPECWGYGRSCWTWSWMDRAERIPEALRPIFPSWSRKGPCSLFIKPFKIFINLFKAPCYELLNVITRCAIVSNLTWLQLVSHCSPLICASSFS